MTLFIAFPTTYVICLIYPPSLIRPIIETSVHMSVPIVMSRIPVMSFLPSPTVIKKAILIMVNLHRFMIPNIIMCRPVLSLLGRTPLENLLFP